MDELEIPEGAKIIDTLKFGGLLSGAIILVVMWFLVRLVTAALERVGARLVHRRLVIQQISTVLRFMLYIGGISLAIGTSVTLSKEVILALTGTAAVTIGFALKDLAASILAGLTLLVDRPFQVGDRVQFDRFAGQITAIGLRSVRLLDDAGQLVTIPNNKFLTEAVASANYGRLDTMLVLEFFISPSQDIMRAKRIVGECITSNRYVFLGRPWQVTVEQKLCDFGSVVKLTASAYVLDVKYRDDYLTTVTERVLGAFREKQIVLPGETPVSPTHFLHADIPATASPS
jgi:small-conductance mechanosensitive channel